MAKTDSVWKDLLDAYFPDFTALLYPDIHARIDWKKGFDPRDKELQKLEPLNKKGIRLVDKLMEVRLIGGESSFVLVHIEVQARPDPDFAHRMFTYYYRIIDRYDRPVISLAVLSDEDPSWRPDVFEVVNPGTRIELKYSIAKLLDFRARWDELSESRNRFAVVVQAFLKLMETREDLAERGRWKLEVMKGFYEKKVPREEMLRIVRFIDQILDLPEELKEQIRIELIKTEKRKNMTYVTSYEQAGIKKGRKEGRLNMARESVLEALEVRFGDVPQSLKKAVNQIPTLEKCKSLLQAAIRAESMEAFKKQLQEVQ